MWASCMLGPTNCESTKRSNISFRISSVDSCMVVLDAILGSHDDEARFRPRVAVLIGSADDQYKCSKKPCTLALLIAAGALGPKVGQRRSELGNGLEHDSRICGHSSTWTCQRSTIFALIGSFATPQPGFAHAQQMCPRFATHPHSSHTHLRLKQRQTRS